MEILHAGNLQIRRLYQTDAYAVLAAVQSSQKEIGAWEGWCHENYGLSDAQEFVQFCEQSWTEQSSYSFGIFEANSDLLVGTVAINQIQRQHNLANLGYWIRTAKTGRGLASRAALTAAKFAFETLHLSRVEIVVQAGNHASRRVALKIGASEEGLARNRLWYRGIPKDAVVYSLIPADLGC